jgi:3-hydroxybutyryl-CoA dehydrogenase
LAARRKKASTPTGKPAYSAAGRIICLFGESPLVEEYAIRCLSKGFDVHARFNPAARTKRSPKHAQVLLPKGARSVTKPSPSTYLALELTNTSRDDKKKNLQDLARALPARCPILSSSVTVTVTEQSGWLGSPARLIGIGALPSLLEGSLLEFAASPMTDDTTLAAAREFAGALDKEIAFVQDSIGLVLPRILCMLANEACFAVMEGVASGGDIDTAMKLGTNYPNGPLEWTDRIGLRQVYAVMRAMADSFGEDRYRVAPLLHRASLLNAFPSR